MAAKNHFELNQLGLKKIGVGFLSFILAFVFSVAFGQVPIANNQTVATNNSTTTQANPAKSVTILNGQNSDGSLIANKSQLKVNLNIPPLSQTSSGNSQSQTSPLFVGGAFNGAGNDTNYNVPALNIGQWDGTTWSALGSGTNGQNGEVYASIIYNGKLIVGGHFNQAGGNAALNIAQWDGTTWSALGSGTNGAVNALTIYNNKLIAGGGFSQAGGKNALNVAEWDGTTWSALHTSQDPGPNGRVNALAVYNNKLIVGGYFSAVGNQYGSTYSDIAQSLAQWDGTTWSAVGGIGNEGNIDALAVYNNKLIVGGKFLVGYGTIVNIAQWDGTTWSGLSGGVGTQDSVYALTVYNNQLIAGGAFTKAGGKSALNVAEWDGATWSALGSGLNGENGITKALVIYNNQLIAGGHFNQAGGITALNVASWNGTKWSALGLGTKNGSVYTLAAASSNINPTVPAAIEVVDKYDNNYFNYIGGLSITGPTGTINSASSLSDFLSSKENTPNYYWLDSTSTPGELHFWVSSGTISPAYLSNPNLNISFTLQALNASPAGQQVYIEGAADPNNNNLVTSNSTVYWGSIDSNSGLITNPLETFPLPFFPYTIKNSSTSGQGDTYTESETMSGLTPSLAVNGDSAATSGSVNLNGYAFLGHTQSEQTRFKNELEGLIAYLVSENPNGDVKNVSSIPNKAVDLNNLGGYKLFINQGGDINVSASSSSASIPLPIGIMATGGNINFDSSVSNFKGVAIAIGGNINVPPNFSVQGSLVADDIKPSDAGIILTPFNQNNYLTQIPGLAPILNKIYSFYSFQ